MNEFEKYKFYDYYKLFEGMSPQESCDFQLEEWVKGNAYHNPVREECCPDFSCCQPDLLRPENERIAFAKAHKAKDTSFTMAFLGESLGSLSKTIGSKTDIKK